MKSIILLLFVTVFLAMGTFFMYPSAGIKSWFQAFTTRQVQSEENDKPTVPWKSLPPPDTFDETAPEYDEDNPQSNGILVAFYHWPLTEEQQKIILQITQSVGLKPKEQLWRLKRWVFLWDEWYPEIKAEKACDKFKNVSFVRICATNGVLVPEFTKKSTTNIRDCDAIPNELDVKDGELSDYWAQRMIGADLAKELLLSKPHPQKHLVAIFDSHKDDHISGVRGLISGPGEQAVMPELGDSLTSYNLSGVRSVGNATHYFLDVVDKKCRSKNIN